MNRTALLSLLLLIAVCCAGNRAMAGTIRALEVPVPAPPLALETVDGEPKNLAEYRGSVVVVNFWATWCAPCRREMPSMQAIREELSGEGFEILAVSIGDSVTEVGAFAASVEPALTFPLLIDSKGISMQSWTVRGLPTSYVVDRKGDIVYQVEGDLDWTSQPARDVLALLLEQ